MRNLENRLINKGTYNAFASDVIPKEASSESLGMITVDDGIEIARGTERVGNLLTGSGGIEGFKIVQNLAGQPLFFRKIPTKIQYTNSLTGTWTDIVTGLTPGKLYTFSLSITLGGRFVIASGFDGIYKISIVNPTSYRSLYNAAKNYKGKTLLDKGRLFLWDRVEDKNTLYLSYIDKATYTTVTAENVGSGNGSNKTFSGTLAEATGTRNLLAVTFTDSVENFVDNRDGTLTGSLGGTGTINYVTGAYSITFNTAPANASNNVKSTYQYEDSNANGIADFTFTNPGRTAGQGDLFRQDLGGEGILALIPYEGAYYSYKKSAVYRLKLSDDDLSADNNVYREGLGIPSPLAVTVTSRGMVFMNTANPEKPVLTILRRIPGYTDLDPTVLVPQFNFSPYNFDECVVDSWGQYILVSCKEGNVLSNNRLILIHPGQKTVNVLDRFTNCFDRDSGYLYAGDSLSNNVYRLFTGFDDDGSPIEAYWKGNNEVYGLPRNLKRVRLAEFEGDITPSQRIEIYALYDNSEPQYIDEIRGDGAYVDSVASGLVGSDLIGEETIGGDGEMVSYFSFSKGVKIRSPKFRKRMWMIKVLGTGYFKLRGIVDQDILIYEEKLPKKYREANAGS